MTGPEKKYTLIESAFIFLFTGVAMIPILALIGIVLFPLAMLTAWVRWLLWNWFAVPYLHLPTLSYWAVLALGLLAGTFYSSDPPTGHEPTTKEHVNRYLGWVMAQFVALGIGYIIHVYVLR